MDDSNQLQTPIAFTYEIGCAIHVILLEDLPLDHKQTHCSCHVLVTTQIWTDFGLHSLADIHCRL